MDSLEEIRKTMRNYEAGCSDPYNYEVFKEKLIKQIRNNSSLIIKALSDNNFTPDEVSILSEVNPDYISLSGSMEITDALSLWVEKNSNMENTTEIRLYIAEARRIGSSLFI